MIKLLARLFLPNWENTSSPEVRRGYGSICGGMGIFHNMLLFGGKLYAGALSGSVAITADAFNNLSDAGSSVISLLGFRLAGQKPDPQHPFGHGRMEYISGLLVSVAILLMGFELAKTSVEKIITPEPVNFSVISAMILAVSIGVKLSMAFFNGRWGKRIDSPTLRAAATDSLSDSVATTVVLAAALISRVAAFNVDGWCGLLVAAFILLGGLRALSDTITPLLGKPPAPELVKDIERIVMSHDHILGVHDLVVHDYGPGRLMISLHAEVPATGDFISLHDTVDNIENDLEVELGCEAVIHMDPVDVENPLVGETKKKVVAMVTDIDPVLTIHDFRMVPGPTHTNLIFDVVAPFGFRIPDGELTERVVRLVGGLEGDYRAVVRIDKSYVI